MVGRWPRLDGVDGEAEGAIEVAVVTTAGRGSTVREGGARVRAR